MWQAARQGWRGRPSSKHVRAAEFIRLYLLKPPPPPKKGRGPRWGTPAPRKETRRALLIRSKMFVFPPPLLPFPAQGSSAPRRPPPVPHLRRAPAFPPRPSPSQGNIAAGQRMQKRRLRCARPSRSKPGGGDRCASRSPAPAHLARISEVPTLACLPAGQATPSASSLPPARFGSRGSRALLGRRPGQLGGGQCGSAPLLARQRLLLPLPPAASASPAAGRL